MEVWCGSSNKFQRLRFPKSRIFDTFLEVSLLSNRISGPYIFFIVFQNAVMESSRERWNCIPKVVSPKSNFPARGWKSCWSHTLTATSPSAPGRQKSKQRLLKHVVSRLCSLSESCPKPWFIVDLLEYSVMYIYVNTGIWVHVHR